MNREAKKPSTALAPTNSQGCLRARSSTSRSNLIAVGTSQIAAELLAPISDPIHDLRDAVLALGPKLLACPPHRVRGRAHLLACLRRALTDLIAELLPRLSLRLARDVLHPVLHLLCRRLRLRPFVRHTCHCRLRPRLSGEPNRSLTTRQRRNTQGCLVPGTGTGFPGQRAFAAEPRSTDPYTRTRLI